MNTQLFSLETSNFKPDVHFCCDFYSKHVHSFPKWGALHIAAVAGLRKSYFDLQKPFCNLRSVVHFV